MNARRIVTMTGCLLALHAAWLPALLPAEPLAALEEAAIKAAVARVAPCVVRIETVGGLERVGSVLIGAGSTTGFVISADGYIISSAFNFAQRPDSILVTLPGGSRTAAKLVATDYDRKLVLLKIDVPGPLPVPEAAPADQIHVGQWAIALGRTFDGDRPSVSVGIVSAVERIWNKALQTDAKISPSNYGGPLVDIRGRVLGVLSPLTPDAGDEVAGVDWYDSGIGFAVPLEHVLKLLPRMKEGHDLRPGILGISLKSSDLFSPPAIVGACRPNSPAYQAGLRAGDEVVAAGGRPVTRSAQLKMALGSQYAGDRVALTIRRGEQRLEFDVELADKLAPYERPFLGILPRRAIKVESDGEADADAAARSPADPDSGKPDEPPGNEHAPEDEHAPGDGQNSQAAMVAASEPLIIRYVYPGGGAERAGLAAGDTIRAADGKPIANSAAMIAHLNEMAPGQTVSLEVLRGDETKTFQATLDWLPETIPGELPPAHDPAPPDAKADRPAVGAVQLKLPEFENRCLAWVPESYNPALAHGLVVWLHGSERLEDEALLARWKTLCARHDLILLAPRSADPARWQPTEAKLVLRMMAKVANSYRLDRSRIVVHGHEGGGSLAYLVALANRDVVRGVAVVDAAFPAMADPPETDPLRPLAFYTTRAGKAPFAAQLDAGVKMLRAQKFPVSVIDVGPHGRYLTPAELGELARWIDTLDRL